MVKDIEGLIKAQLLHKLFTKVVLPAPEGALIINIFEEFKDLILFIIIIFDYNTHIKYITRREIKWVIHGSQ